MFAPPQLAHEKNYYKGKIDSHGDAEEQNWSAGLAVYDVKNPANPCHIGFMPVKGGGLHRIWYVGGRWACASALLDGLTDYIMVTIDMADSTRPQMVGKCWLPGMSTIKPEAAIE